MQTVCYDAGTVPFYGDIGAYENTGDCCYPAIHDGDLLLVSADALADVRPGGHVVYDHALDGMLHVARLVENDGVYCHVETNHGKSGFLGEFVRGVVVGIIRDGETRALSLG